ncbi:MAG: dockerin type I repeat-containing protein [Phycisphaerae bacterium]|nr:hypothetical protein [Phycisphaerae bacterium]MCZ2398736.1 dockerin type I repeat-containing protein [Phycisphaerae bacterium]NUQ48608.1 hypothetical protein [Phycisphaerae bacterium]
MLKPRHALALLAALALPAAALASVSSYVVISQPPSVSDPAAPNFNDGRYWTIDLHVVVTDGDDWTTSSAVFELAAAPQGVIWQHPAGGHTPPDPELFETYPALPYDTHVAGTGDDVATLGVSSTSRRFSASWFAVPPNGGAGDFVIARFTVRLSPGELAAGTTLTTQDTGQPYATLGGGHTTKNVTQLSPYNFTIYSSSSGTPPEPTPCPGDLNNDGKRNADDLPIFLEAWKVDARGDINGDGITNIIDLALFLAYFELPCE